MMSVSLWTFLAPPAGAYEKMQADCYAKYGLRGYDYIGAGLSERRVLLQVAGGVARGSDAPSGVGCSQNRKVAA